MNISQALEWSHAFVDSGGQDHLLTCVMAVCSNFIHNYYSKFLKEEHNDWTDRFLYLPITFFIDKLLICTWPEQKLVKNHGEFNDLSRIFSKEVVALFLPVRLKWAKQPGCVNGMSLEGGRKQLFTPHGILCCNRFKFSVENLGWTLVIPPYFH